MLNPKPYFQNTIIYVKLGHPVINFGNTDMQ